MATLSIAGVTYPLPDFSAAGWAPLINAILVALSNSNQLASGGLQALTAELDLGPNYGIKVLSIKSEATYPATTGTIRLGTGQEIDWRNAANSGNLALLPSVSELTLTFAGVDLVNLTATQTLTNKTLTSPTITSPTITDSDSWRGVTYVNSWVASTITGESNAQYYKDSSGIVHLRGSAANGTSGTTAFTLPSGYRPQSTVWIPVIILDGSSAYQGTGTMKITTGGVTSFTKTVGSWTGGGGASGEYMVFGQPMFKAT